MGRNRKYKDEEERKAAAAARRRLQRASQTEEKRQNELEKDRLYKQKSKENETEEQKLLRRQNNATSQSQRRSNESPLDTLARRSSQAAFKKMRREQETPEETESRQQRQAEYQKTSRLQETPEETTARQVLDADLHRKRRELETPEETLSRQQQQAKYQKSYREQETSEETSERQVQDADLHRKRREQETPEETLLRQQRQAEYQKTYRRQETPEETSARQVNDADHHRKRRMTEPPVQVSLRHIKEAEAQRNRRQNETLSETMQRQTQDAEAQRNRRRNESPNSRQTRQVNDRQIHRRRTMFYGHQNQQQLQQLANNVTDDETTVTEHNCGQMNIACNSCGSLNFVDEKPSDNQFTQCCQKGKVKLTRQEYPQLLQQLMSGEHEHSQNFMENIRSINSANAFASMGANISPPPGYGPYVFRVHGQIYHRTGTLHPEEGQPPKFAQLYILDTSEATEERLQLKENEKCNRDLMYQIATLMQNINKFANAYKMLREVELEEEERAMQNNAEMPQIVMAIKSDRNQDQRRYNQPRVNEVAIVFQNNDGEPPFDRDILIHLKPDPNQPFAPRFQRINILHGSIDALMYPLFYPRGEEGWHPNISQTGPKNRRVTQMQYYSYLLCQRDYFNPLLNGGKLTQQFVVDAYCKIEANRLQFIRMNQQQLKVEDYCALQTHIQQKSTEKGIPIGKTVVLPSTFEGSPRSMQQRYQDAICIAAKYGRPDFFVTMTCNPKWKEITENLQPWQRAENRPDLVARVFKLKLKSLLKDIKNGLFGNVVAMLHVIEFQKRGLPHAHILLILDAESKLHSEQDIDNIVWAEIPDQEKYPELHRMVLSHMIHGPCGAANPKCPCMTPGTGENIPQCSKGFPKDLREHTNKDVNGYPSYRRRVGADCVRNGKIINNSWVVPFNPFLLKKYNCHINVEVCASIKSIKYLYKYVYKGHDQANVAIEERVVNHDEPAQFVDSRYVSPPEAMWRIFAFPMHAQSHTIVRLAVHLPNQQQLYFHENSTEQQLQNTLNKTSTLLEWFELNKRDENARQYLYHEIPEHYIWNAKDKQWKPRQRGADKVIGRMYTVSLSDTERYFLRLIALHVRGAQGFEELKTANQVVYSTFKDAAIAMGLLLDDSTWRNTILDGILLQLPKQLRETFAYICIFGLPANALELWQEFKQHFTEDYCHRLHTTSESCIECESQAMKDVNDILTIHGRSFAEFNLPIPSTHFVNLGPVYDLARETDRAEFMKQSLNPQQLAAFDSIVMATENGSNDVPKCFFIDGPGGSGKTYLYELLMHHVRGQGKNVLAAATTGIAANLLQGGRTMHSFYGIPIPLNDTSVSTIKPGTIASQILKTADLLILDECTMASKYALSVMDQVLRESVTTDVREKCLIPFGAKVLVLGGDFRQCLPVVPNGSRTDIIESCLKMSVHWSKFKQLQLISNMRSHDPEYSEWLLKLGNGKLTNEYDLGEDIIEIPEDMLSSSCIVSDIFGKSFDIDVNDPESVRVAASHAILCPKNTDADLLNSQIIDRIPGEIHVYKSDDSVVADTEEERNNYPVEFLNSLTPSGLPNHRLSLKVGTIIMLLRNLNTRSGLCNGTRLIVIALRQHLIQAKIISGSAEGQIVLIPRIDFCPSETGLPFRFRRRQFPVKPAFAMTINKSQGQTMDRVGIYLPEPVFAHGQLYVAFSRVKLRSSVKVYVEDTPLQGKLVKGSSKVFTKNVVYANVL